MKELEIFCLCFWGLGVPGVGGGGALQGQGFGDCETVGGGSLCILEARRAGRCLYLGSETSGVGRLSHLRRTARPCPQIRTCAFSCFLAMFVPAFLEDVVCAFTVLTILYRTIQAFSCALQVRVIFFLSHSGSSSSELSAH